MLTMRLTERNAPVELKLRPSLWMTLLRFALETMARALRIRNEFSSHSSRQSPSEKELDWDLVFVTESYAHTRAKFYFGIIPAQKVVRSQFACRLQSFALLRFTRWNV